MASDEIKDPETKKFVSGLAGQDGRLSVNAEMAAWVVSKGTFSEGGYRICRKDKRIQKVTAEQLVQWLSTTGSPRCQICNQKTEIVTAEDLERNPL